MKHVMSPADICAQSGRDISTFWLRHVETVRVVAPGAEPGQVQQGCREGSGEGSGEGLGSFCAEPGQAQQGFRRRSGRVWCRAEPGQVQQRAGKGSGRARFNELPEKVLEKVPEGFCCGQVQRGFKYVPVPFRECVGAAFRSSSSKFPTNKLWK